MAGRGRPGPDAVSVRPPVAPAGDGVAVPFQWGGLAGYDLLGAHPVAPDGAVAVSQDDYEAVRIEAGFPRHGAELDERTIPAEAGLVEASVELHQGVLYRPGTGGPHRFPRVATSPATFVASC